MLGKANRKVQLDVLVEWSALSNCGLLHLHSFNEALLEIDWWDRVAKKMESPPGYVSAQHLMDALIQMREVNRVVEVHGEVELPDNSSRMILSIELSFEIDQEVPTMHFALFGPTALIDITEISIDLVMENERPAPPPADVLAMGRLQASLLHPLSRYAEYGLHPLEGNDPAFLFVEDLVVNTVASHRHSLASTTYAPAPKLRVVEVEKVENARLLDKYRTACTDLEGLHRHSGCEPLHDFENLAIHPGARPLGLANINEYFGFHGAPSDVIYQICKAGFNPQLGGTSAGRLFGAATYFASNSSKCDGYTEVRSFPRRRRAERKMVVSLLAMGKSFRVMQSCMDRLCPPDGFQSLWAECREHGGCVDHKEMMIYKEQQALPLFVVTYVHDCPADALCAECCKRPS